MNKKYKDFQKYSQLILAAQRNLEAERIAIMENGRERRLRELQLEYDQTIDKIHKLRDASINAYNKENKPKKPVNIENYESALPDVFKNTVEREDEALKKLFKSRIELGAESAKKVQAIWEEVNARSLTNLEKERKAIEKKYAEQIKAAKEGYDFELAAQLEIVKQKELIAANQKSSLQENTFNQEVETAQLDKRYNELGMTEYFEQEKTNILLKYAQERKGILEQMDTEDSRKELKKLTIQIEEYKNTASKPTSWKGFIDQKLFEGVKNIFSKHSKDAAEAEKKTISFFSAIKKTGNDAVYVFSTMKTALGGISPVADQALDAVMNVAQGFAKGGLVGGIAAAVGEAAKLTVNLINADKKYQAEKKKFLQEQLVAQREYNLLLMEQNRLQKKGMEGVLYSNYIKEIKNASDSAQYANGLLNDLYAETRAKQNKKFDSAIALPGGIFKSIRDEAIKNKEALAGMTDINATLSSIQIKTGTQKKSGWFGIKYGSEDVYGSLLDNLGSKYGTLVDETGKLNIETAKLILKNEQLDEEGKITLENLVAYSEAYEASLQQIRDVISNIFGNLGDELGNSLLDAFKKGEDGLQSFQESFNEAIGKMVESLLINMVVSEFFGDIIDKWGKKLQTTLTGTMTEDQRAAELVTLAGDLMSDIGGQVEFAFGFMETISNQAGQLGLNIFQKDQDLTKKPEPTSLSGSVQTVTEETASVLAGQINAIRISQADGLNVQSLMLVSLVGVEDFSRQAVAALRDSIVYQQETAQNTRYLVEITAMIRGIVSTGQPIETDEYRAKGL